ncbi:hypothetical protein JW998_07310 [candidate division KSB1 bacterium]|nr:hypothetical protein [candidate division KSB1 bacterium]
MTNTSSTPLVGVEGVKEKVTDYEGYGNAATRARSDKIIRLYLSGKIKELIKQLNADYVTDEKDQNRLDSLINSTKRKLATIQKSLNSPTYQQEQFIAPAVLPAQRLARIYDLEKSMMEDVANIAVELAGLHKNCTTRTVFEEHFLHIDAFVDNINQALFEREALILGDV